MSKMKIIIKCDGMTLRTKDLGMGLSVLNRISQFGVNKHSWVPNALLNRVNRMLDKSISAGQGLIDIVKKQNKPAEKAQETVQEAVVKSAKTKRKKIMINSWTLEEDKMICDLLNKRSRDVVKNRELLKRHTPDAIGTRYSTIKHRHFGQLAKDRANMLKAYLTNEEVKTSVATINKTVSPLAKKLSKIKESPEARNKRKFRPEWTNDELNAIKLNLDMSPKDLAKLPWLKNRTRSAINFKRHQLKAKEKYEA